MKVTLMQIDLSWGDPIVNIRRNEQRLAKIEKTDLVIFPEMFSTGFATSPEGIAEKDGATLEWMKETSRRYGFAMAGSIATEDNGRYYNRLYFVEPSGKVTTYDKRHLFSFGGEDLRYTPGDEKVIVEYQGFRILLQVCYDLRFPETCRNGIDPKTGKPEYDLAIFVASWPVKRVEAWSLLLRARGIENQSFVIGVNRVGTDHSCDYTGASGIFGPLGKTLVECTPGEEEIKSAELDKAHLDAFRESFPVLKDIIPADK
jgi:omega-amidase